MSQGEGVRGTSLRGQFANQRGSERVNEACTWRPDRPLTHSPEAEPADVRSVWEAGGFKQVHTGKLTTARSWQRWFGHGKHPILDIPDNNLCYFR